MLQLHYYRCQSPVHMCGVCCCCAICDDLYRRETIAAALCEQHKVAATERTPHRHPKQGRAPCVHIISITNSEPTTIWQAAADLQVIGCSDDQEELIILRLE